MSLMAKIKDHAAKALWEHFRTGYRHRAPWESTDEVTKEGSRFDATVVIDIVKPAMVEWAVQHAEESRQFGDDQRRLAPTEEEKGYWVGYSSGAATLANKLRAEAGL